MDYNAKMDVAVLKEVIQNLIPAYQLLEKPVPKKYSELYHILPEYMNNAEGSVKEWIDPDKEENYNHRRLSQFYTICQSIGFTQEARTIRERWYKALDYRV